MRYNESDQEIEIGFEMQPPAASRNYMRGCIARHVLMSINVISRRVHRTLTHPFYQRSLFFLLFFLEALTKLTCRC
jgi:hypothetical protein